MKKLMFLLGASLLLAAGVAQAQFVITPYASIKSNKTIVPDLENEGQEEERIDERQEFGLRASLGIGSFFSFQLGLGQSKSKITEKAALIKDTYDKIDLQEELNVSTDDPNKDIRITETQNVGSASLVFDPSFSVFVFRFKLGITALQRIFVKDEVGLPTERLEDGPTYLPHSGVGIGIEVTSGMYFMVEYEFLHYNYPPSAEPFERQLTVSYSMEI